MTLNIKVDNAAFWDANCESEDQEHPEHMQAMAYECARILREVAERLENGDEAGACVDVNGNRVGNFSL